jgi:hypothetical protein
VHGGAWFQPRVQGLQRLLSFVEKNHIVMRNPKFAVIFHRSRELPNKIQSRNLKVEMGWH